MATRVRNGWWLVVAGIFAALLALNVVGVFVLAIRGPRLWLLLAPVPFLIDYWFMMGAWLRTSWGHPAPDAPAPPGPPGLSARTALIMTGLAAACVVAVAVALAVQLHNAGY